MNFPQFFADSSVLAATLRGHSDAVWSLAYNTSRQQLLSASGDGTVKLWSPTSKTQPLLRTFENECMPTSVEWVKEDLTHMVAAYANADCVIYDIETGNPVIKLDTAQVRLLSFQFLKIQLVTENPLCRMEVESALLPK